MKPNTINAYILTKLGFPHPMDYDVKPDGSLAVIDANGQKFVIPYKDYSALLIKSIAKTPANKGRNPESRQPQVALDQALCKGEEPIPRT